MGEGFPLWSLASMAWEGREPLRDWICLSVSLCFCAPDSGLSPFLIFPEIRNSDWPETFTVIFPPNISFLAAKEERQPPYGWPMRVQGTPRGVGMPPVSWPPRTLFRVDSSSGKSQIFQNNSPSVFIPFDKTYNKHELALGTGSIC